MKRFGMALLLTVLALAACTTRPLTPDQRAAIARMMQSNQQATELQQANLLAEERALAQAATAARGNRPVNCTTSFVGAQAYTHCQ